MHNPQLIKPEELTLSNGIPVVLQHFDGPVAANYWWVQTGSADETQKEAGFAHFLEHMLFKDAAAKETGRASTGQMARAVESLGGDINAYTSFDQTVYHVTCASEHWERVLDAFGSMAKPQKFLKSDFDREREVILEELRKNEDSPSRQLFQSMFSQSYKKHPYGRPVIGLTRTLKAAKLSELEAFYRRNYVTGKMGIVLVGPIQDRSGARRKSILRYLEKHFGSRVLKKREGVPIRRPLEAELRKNPELVTRKFDVQSPMASFSFRVPGLMHPDIPALDLLAGILGMGELSRFYQRLFHQTSLVTEVSGSLYIPKDPGLLYMQFETESSEKLSRSSEEVFQELKKIRDEGPTSDELARVIVNAESERLYATQTADGMAGRLGFLKFVLGDLSFDEKYLADLRQVDETKIREVASQYISPQRMSGAFLLPKEGPDFETGKIAELAESALASSKAIPLKAPRQPEKSGGHDLPVEITQLPSGIRVAYFERPQSHVFSIHASVLGGVRLELAKPMDRPEKDWGTSYMMALTWAKGTEKLGAREIAAITEGHAAGIDGFSGRNSVGLQMTGLARDWGKLSPLFTEVLLEPAFSDEEVNHSRRVAEDSLRSLEDHSSQLCSKLFLENLYETHPYGKLTIGSLESLAAMNPGKLRSFHKAWVRPERLVISVCGAVNRKALQIWLEALDHRARTLGDRPGIPIPDSLPDEQPLKAPRWVEKPVDREQTHILVGGLGAQIFSDDRYGLQLLQTLLGGQSGRLFIELREKRSLAYTVSPLSFEGLERGYIGTYIACARQKRKEAIDGIRKVLERLAKEGPRTAEMHRAKEYFLGRRAMDLQSDSALAAHYGLEVLYRIPHLSEVELVRKVRSVTAHEIQRSCRKYLVDPYMVTSVVG